MATCLHAYTGLSGGVSQRRRILGCLGLLGHHFGRVAVGSSATAADNVGADGGLWDGHVELDAPGAAPGRIAQGGDEA